MPEMQWALATVRDDDDTLRSEWIRIPVEDRPYANDAFPRLFHAARMEVRVTFADIATALHTTAVHVSRVESGIVEVPPDAQAAWWEALWGCIRSREEAGA